MFSKFPPPPKEAKGGGATQGALPTNLNAPVLASHQLRYDSIILNEKYI